MLVVAFLGGQFPDFIDCAGRKQQNVSALSAGDSSREIVFFAHVNLLSGRRSAIEARVIASLGQFRGTILVAEMGDIPLSAISILASLHARRGFCGKG